VVLIIVSFIKAAGGICTWGHLITLVHGVKNQASCRSIKSGTLSGSTDSRTGFNLQCQKNLKIANNKITAEKFVLQRG
jgi:hypothetical protein